jgi:hypothetical protein
MHSLFQRTNPSKRRATNLDAIDSNVKVTLRKVTNLSFPILPYKSFKNSHLRLLFL